MPRSTKPRPKSVREVADEMIGSEAYFTDERPSIDTLNRGNDVSTKGDRIKDVSISIMDIDTAIIKYIEEKYNNDPQYAKGLICFSEVEHFLIKNNKLESTITVNKKKCSIVLSKENS